MIVATAVWRRLDLPGHDACRVSRHDGGWTLAGTAVYRDTHPACLAYRVDCTTAWETLRAEVSGFARGEPVQVAIERRGTTWSLNGAPVADLGPLVDVDFGFTPATNYLPLHRLPTPVGTRIESPAAWFDIDARTLTALPQTYERLDEARIAYTSPTAGYAEILHMLPNGFVRTYPHLWEAEI